MAGGLIHGLTRADTEEMTLGEFIEIMVEYNKILDPPKDEQEHVRQATQADFDNF